MENADEHRQIDDEVEEEKEEEEEEPRLSEEEGEEEAQDLPERDVMSLLLDPGSLLGGLSPGLSASPTSPVPPPTAATPGTSVPTPGGTIAIPHLPVPQANPGGTYAPDTSSTSET